MSESLTKRVAQFMQDQPARRSGKGRVVVLALREEIRKALDDGWSVKAVWQTLRAEGSVQVGYHAFRRHVATLISSEQDRHRPVHHATRSVAPPAQTADKPRHFHHERVPNRKEIYG